MKTIGSVTRPAAIGSFQAVGANSTLSNETRIVAGRLMEKTIEASRSAWDLLRSFKERRRTPARKMRMKAMRDGGMERESSREDEGSARRSLSRFVDFSRALTYPSSRKTRNGE